MEDLYDPFKFTKEEKILTEEFHKIKGLTLSSRVIHKASGAIDMHYHADSIEIFCLVKGNRIINVDGRYYTVRGNEIFVIYPKETHSTSYYTQSPGKFYGIRVNLSESSILGLNGEFSAILTKLLLSLDRHYRLTPEALGLIDSVLAEFCIDGEFSRYIAASYLGSFLFSIKGLQPVSGVTEVDDYIKIALAYIEQNYHIQIKIERLAAVSGLSMSHFKNKFKDNMGMTPSEYVNFVKIETAKQSLSQGNASITELAYELGFCSSDYFSTVFKKFVLLSPNEYRLRSRDH